MLNYRDPKATKVTMKGDWVYRGGRRLGYVHHQGFGRSAGSKSWRFGVTPTGNPRSSAWSSTHPGSIRSPRRSPHACPHGPASPSSAKSSPAGEPGRGGPPNPPPPRKVRRP